MAVNYIMEKYNSTIFHKKVTGKGFDFVGWTTESHPITFGIQH